MDDGLGTAPLVALGVIALVAVLLAGGTLYVVRKYRLPLRGVAAALSGLAYLLSPVDAVPEIPLGPVGLIDDIAVVIAAGMYVRALIEARRQEIEAAAPDRTVPGGAPRDRARAR